MHFTKKQNYVQAFVKLNIRPITHLCRQYVLQEVFTPFCFLVKITARKSVLILHVIRAFTFCFCFETAYYVWWL